MPQASNTTASLRGLSVVSSQVAWASGTAGTFLRTTDGGLHWQPGQVPGAAALDFRDVEAFDADSALLLAAGPGPASRIYKTTDAGAHWTLTLSNLETAGFFDAFAFWDRLHGMLLGDPVGGRFTVFVTRDGGATWTKATQPPALEKEGAFAASGTCVAVIHQKSKGHDAWFGTGGPKLARVFHTTDFGKTWTVSSTPLDGIFSVVFTDSRHGFAVGGDYHKPADPARTIAITKDAGKTWAAAGSLGGYRSAIAYATKPRKFLVAVGTSGSDVSTDMGRTWQTFASGNFNAVAGVGSDIWAVGPKGSVAKLSINSR